MPTIVISNNTGADYSGVLAVQIKSNAATTPNANGSTTETTSWQNGSPEDRTFTLLEFPSPNLGASLSVQSATLELYHETFSSGTRTIDAHELLRDINTSTTWNKYDGTNDWTTPGALSNSDRAPTALVSLAVAATSGWKSWSSVPLAAYIQTALIAQIPIRLWLSRNPTTAYDSLFNNWRGNGASDGFRPKLTIVYSTIGVTSVDSDDVVRTTQTNVQIAGAGFKATQGTGTVQLISGAYSVALPVVSWTDTLITVNMALGQMPYGTGVKVRVTNSDSAVADRNITLLPGTGEIYATLTSVYPTGAFRITSTADLAVGDQLHAYGVGGGAAPAGLVLNTNGTYYFTAGNAPAPFDVKVRDGSDGNWGAGATQSLQDIIPPSAAGTPSVSALQWNQATISYSAASDNVGVTTYESQLGSGAWVNRGNVLSFSLTGLVGNTSYTVRVRAKDAAGNTGPDTSVTFTTPVQPDTTPPTPPGTPTVSLITASTARVTYSPSTDNVAVVAYEYQLNNLLPWINVGNVTQVDLTGLTADSDYIFGVRARDAAGNVSTTASSAGFHTTENVPPTNPGSVTVSSITGTGAVVSYTAATDNIGVTGYESSMDGETWTNRGNVLSFPLSDLTQNTQYTVRVRAYDAAGNRGSFTPATFTTLDTQAPSVPTGLAASSITRTTATVSCAAASDNVGVTAYVWRLGGSVIATTAGTSTPLTGLSPNTTYSVTAAARDAAGNESPQSAAVSFMTGGTPGVPTGVTVISITGSTATVSWIAPGGTPAAASYIVKVNGVDTTATVSTSKVLLGLIAGTVNTVTVRALDALGNEGAETAVIQFLTPIPDTTPPSAPTGLTTGLITGTSIALSWTPSSDDVGVLGYHVWVNGVKVTVSPITVTAYEATGLTPATLYALAVTAVDAANNESLQSEVLNTATLDTSGGGPESFRYGGGPVRIVRPRRATK